MPRSLVFVFSTPSSRSLSTPAIGLMDLSAFHTAASAGHSRSRLLLLIMFNRCSVELVQLGDASPTADQGRHRQSSLCFVFRVNNGPSIVGASLASPVKIPKIALRVDQ